MVQVLRSLLLARNAPLRVPIQRVVGVAMRPIYQADKRAWLRKARNVSSVLDSHRVSDVNEHGMKQVGNVSFSDFNRRKAELFSSHQAVFLPFRFSCDQTSERRIQPASS